ncbi:MAG: ribonuclease P protein component [Chloroflexi bacterium RBG_19FT_COMBO_47_9]|nr:MAG: ribonuclease P protein component [Chloroflexi bacterium RBG_19FT_COMBO_47_9]
MNRNFRLTQGTNFERVRRFGKSYAHPLVVLVVQPSAERQTRFGVVAGKSVGNAVQRNRAKRMLREALRTLIPIIKPGWNVILISRTPILTAKFTEIQVSLRQLFFKADLLIDNNGN